MIWWARCPHTVLEGGEEGTRETGWCHSAGFKDGEGPRTKDCRGLWKCEEGREPPEGAGPVDTLSLVRPALDG